MRRIIIYTHGRPRALGRLACWWYRVRMLPVRLRTRLLFSPRFRLLLLALLIALALCGPYLLARLLLS